MSSPTLPLGHGKKPLDVFKQRLLCSELSKKQREVLRAWYMVAQGDLFTTDLVRDRLGMAMDAYKWNMSAIYGALDMKNVSQNDKKVALLHFLFIIKDDLEVKRYLKVN